MSDTPRAKHITPTKRKRAHLFRYDSSSDTEEEGENSQPEAKRVRRVKQGAVGAVDQGLLDLAQSEEGDLDEDPSWDDGEEETQESLPADIAGVDDDHEEYAVDHARSAKVSKEVNVDDYFVSPDSHVDPHGFPWDDALSAVELRQIFDIQEYINSLPRLLTRRARTDLVENRPEGKKLGDEPLRVKLLAKQLKRKIRSGSLTPSELDELAAQRPPYLTCGDFHTQELEPLPEGASESWDSTDFEEEDSSAPARPSTPLPPSDSDSDSDSDDDEPPVYSSREISYHLSLREMEKMGIYPDGE